MSISEDVTLVIGGSPLICKKMDLVSNSDYFKVMFEGDFLEKNRDTVTIQGIEPNAMAIIISLIWDKELIVGTDEIFSVLQAASMLQFKCIEELCIERLTEYLCPSLSLQTWILAERLSIKPLYMKAKLLALNSFLEIKDMDCIDRLNIEEIHKYLGNVYLKTDTELTVFETAMKWWYEKSANYSSDVLLQLLSCVSFKDMTSSELKEAMLYQDIKDCEDIFNVLQCLASFIDCKTKEYSDHTWEIAKYFQRSKSRITPYTLCMLMDINYDNKKTIAFKDKYKRKRYYEHLNHVSTVVSYDSTNSIFELYFAIGKSKLYNGACQIISCKNFVFLFGGANIGVEPMNHNLWVFDLIRERWERKSTFKVPRMHSETCIVGNKLYIVGGCSLNYAIRKDLIWYDFKHNLWSELIGIPTDRIKCCCYSDKLFLIRRDVKRAYFFENGIWTEIKVDMSDELFYCHEFEVFSYKKRLFLKGQNLVEMTLKDCCLSVVSTRKMTDKDYTRMNVVVCDEFVYTFFEYFLDACSLFSLEKYNIDTTECVYIFRDAEYNSDISVAGTLCSFPRFFKIFASENYNSIAKNDKDLVNDIKDFPR